VPPILRPAFDLQCESKAARFSDKRNFLSSTKINNIRSPGLPGGLSVKRHKLRGQVRPPKKIRIVHKECFGFRFSRDRRFMRAPHPTNYEEQYNAMAAFDSNVLKLAPDATAPAYRTAPHNIEAEQSVLGAILVNNDAFYRVSDFLEPKHFFEPIHEVIYETASSLIRAGKVATPVTLKTFVPADTDIGGMTVSQYLARLAAEATTIINAHDYGRTIYELALRRDLIRIGEDMVNVAFDAPVDFAPRAQIEDAERRLYELAESGRYDGGFQRFAQAMKVALDMAANAYSRDGRLSGIATGLRELDTKMGGLQRSDLIIVAGRPGMGKTALATNIAYNIARAHQDELQVDGTRKTINGGIVGFFSCEMSAEQLATRILAEQTGIASSAIRRGGITESEFEKIRDHTIELEHLPLYVDETGGLSISQLTARARRLKRQKGLDVIMVDYIQLLQGSSKRSDNRVQEVTEITTSLKALAKELDCPVVALSQLSRQVESRDDKHPQLSDLRESGSIEQDADVVLFVFREEYYLQNKEPRAGTPEHEKWQLDMSLVHGKAEVIIAKQRHGPTGTVELQFEGQFTRFSDLIPDSHLPAYAR
jgi:replicative DNA helicase